MKSDLELQFLSDQIQNCFNELFRVIYNESEDFLKAICQLSIYLISDKNNYDYILKKYNIKSKEILIRMFISNFLEITYYRRKNNIPLDKERLGLLNTIENLPSLENRPILSFISFNPKQFVIMINDVLLYFWHLSPMYSYNATQSIIKDGFSKKLYEIYPVAFNEHLLTLNDTYSKKEWLLFTFYEVLINETEKIEFSQGGFPTPSAGYIQKLTNILKEYNGHNPSLPNIHKAILDNFQLRTDILNNNEAKLLLLEIIISLIKLKEINNLPLEIDEKLILSTLLKQSPSYYDKNNQTLISILINNFSYFSYEEILEDKLNNNWKMS